MTRELPTVLVIEDELLVAWSLIDELQAQGWKVLGPFGDVASAQQAAATLSFDIAVLDINLRGEMSFPVAEHIASRGIPYVFLTGYSNTSLPEQFRSVAWMSKPCNGVELRRRLSQLLDVSGSHSHPLGSAGFVSAISGLFVQLSGLLL
jgi:DNA-binding response OmpR family regulator